MGFGIRDAGRGTNPHKAKVGISRHIASPGEGLFATRRGIFSLPRHKSVLRAAGHARERPGHKKRNFCFAEWGVKQKFLNGRWDSPAPDCVFLP